MVDKNSEKVKIGPNDNKEIRKNNVCLFFYFRALTKPISSVKLELQKILQHKI